MELQAFHDTDLRQINFLDSRYYTFDGKKFLPSVTTILEVYPKGFGFDQWLKDMGSNASMVAERAAAIGSKIHQLTEELNNGQELKWADEEGNAYFTLDEWKLLLRYADFWGKLTPELIANEKSFCSEKLEYGGTLDRVLKIAGKRYLVDIKTSNYLHTSHELQLSAYAELWNEFNPHEPIEGTGILWLKANIRTDKIDIDKEIFQGVSESGAWQLKIYERHYTDAFKIFKHTQAIWKEENPRYVPANMVLPDRIKL